MIYRGVKMKRERRCKKWEYKVSINNLGGLYEWKAGVLI